MKTAEEILESWHQDFDKEFEVPLKKDTVVPAMQEYAEEYLVRCSASHKFK